MKGDVLSAGRADNLRQWLFVAPAVYAAGGGACPDWNKPAARPPALWQRLETAIGEQIVFASAPEDGVAEEAGDPHQEAGNILKRREPPETSRQRVAQHVAGGG